MSELKKRIEECKELATKIIAANPGVSTISFDLQDVDINEIKEFDPNPRVWDGKLRGLVNSYEGNCVIWACTKPFKSAKVLEYEF